jgi:hypothetical protein
VRVTHEPYRHPDLLQRFVSTPYVFSNCQGTSRICVASNDLEIALGVRRSNIGERLGEPSGDFLCKLIRDAANPVVAGSIDDLEISIVSSGALRVLFFGTGTILMHDRDRSELLGFVSRTVSAQELVSFLIPTLLDR